MIEERYTLEPEQNCISSFDELAQCIRRNYTDANEVLEVVRIAFEFADSRHAGVARKSGEPYITHPLSVAFILARIHADKETLCAALLHDTIEDTEATEQEITSLFGEEVAFIVEGCTNIEWDRKESDRQRAREIADSATIKKVVEKTIINHKVLAIKLADRIHNMSTMKAMDVHKAYMKALETERFYIPMARYYGINILGKLLEELTLKYFLGLTHKSSNVETSQTEYERILQMRDTYLAAYKESIEKFINCLNGLGLRAEFRFKSLSDFYADDIYKRRPEEGLLTVRIIVPEFKDFSDVQKVLLSRHLIFNGKTDNTIGNHDLNGQEYFCSYIMLPGSGFSAKLELSTELMNIRGKYGVFCEWGGVANASTSELNAQLAEIIDVDSADYWQIPEQVRILTRR